MAGEYKRMDDEKGTTQREISNKLLLLCRYYVLENGTGFFIFAKTGIIIKESKINQIIKDDWSGTLSLL